MSDVWELFQKIQDNDNVVISINCQLCEAEYGTATSTSTLRRHLISFHSSVYTSNNKQQRQTTPYTPAEQKHITVKLAQWISVDLQPFGFTLYYTMQANYKARSGLIIFTKKSKYSIRNK